MNREVSTLPDRTPPQNVDLEMCVLGGIMIEPERGYEVAADIVKPDDFYLRGHGAIFEIMGILHGRRIPPDAQSVIDELQVRGQLEQAGGAACVMGMMNSVGTGASIEQHARKVAEKSLLRQTIQAMTETIDACYQQEQTSDEILGTVEEWLIRTNQSARHDSNPTQLAAARIDAMAERVAAEKQAGRSIRHMTSGVSTGLLGLDYATRGLEPQTLTIIAGRPAEGKTALALTMAHQMATRQIPVAFFSLEMSGVEVGYRMLSLASMYYESANRNLRCLEIRRLRVPDFGPEEQIVYKDAIRQNSALPLRVLDGATTIQEMRAALRGLVLRHGIKCVFVDYIQLIGSKLSTQQRYREVANVSSGLKGIAKALNIPVVALSQRKRPTRDAKTGKAHGPQLDDLYESGALEADADNVIFIRHHEAEQERAAHQLMPVDLLIAKQRQGPTCKVPMHWYPECMRFLDVAQGERNA